MAFERSTSTGVRRPSRVVRTSLRGSSRAGRAFRHEAPGSGVGEEGLLNWQSCKDGTFEGNQLDFARETCDGWIENRARLAVLSPSAGGARTSGVVTAWLAAGACAGSSGPRQWIAGRKKRGMIDVACHLR